MLADAVRPGCGGMRPFRCAVPSLQTAEELTEDTVLLRLARNAALATRQATNEQVWLLRAVGYFDECLAVNPENHRARSEYAGLLLQFNQPSNSLHHYEILLAVSSTNMGWLVSAAIAATASRDFDKAAGYYRNALAVKHAELDALSSSSFAENVHRQREQLDIKADLFTWRLELARVLSWGRAFDESIELYDRLIAEYPQQDVLRKERSRVLFYAGRFPEFLVHSAEVVSADPDDVSMQLNRIRAAVAEERFTDAIAECDKILDVDPRHREALITRVKCRLWTGDYPTARKELESLLEVLPEEESLIRILALAYLWDRQYEPALKLLRTLDVISLEDIEAAQGYAEALVGLGKAELEDRQPLTLSLLAIGRSPCSRPWPARSRLLANANRQPIYYAKLLPRIRPAASCVWSWPICCRTWASTMKLINITKFCWE